MRAAGPAVIVRPLELAIGIAARIVEFGILRDPGFDSDPRISNGALRPLERRSGVHYAGQR